MKIKLGMLRRLIKETFLKESIDDFQDKVWELLAAPPAELEKYIVHTEYELDAQDVPVQLLSTLGIDPQEWIEHNGEQSPDLSWNYDQERGTVNIHSGEGPWL